MLRKIWKFIWKAVLYFIAISVVWVLILKFVNPPITYLMIQRGFEYQSKGEGFKLKKDWVKYEDLNDHLKRAAIASEDARFMNHWGFDTEAIKEAYERNKNDQSTLRGGSTISQQTAKNVFLWPQRSYVRKAFEAYFTLLIEVIWGKKRILEVYLNIIETGEGIYGAQAVAQAHFKKDQSELSKRQAAQIIAVLPNPRRWNSGKPTAYIQKRTNQIMRYMTHYQIP